MPGDIYCNRHTAAIPKFRNLPYGVDYREFVSNGMAAVFISLPIANKLKIVKL